jgi:1,3-beta-glucan synthase
MSGHQQAHYDDGYGHQQHGNTDSYYQDENQYYDHNSEGYAEHGHQGGDGYYDES